MNDNLIFINCPFDDEYRPLLKVLLFTCAFYGLDAQLSSMRSEDQLNRLDAICKMIESSKYSVHDLSRAKAKDKGEFFRMNMPFELGLDYGMKNGKAAFLIFEESPYDLKKALSDIAGWDVRNHNCDPQILIEQFRQWWFNVMLSSKKNINESSATEIWYKYNDFQIDYEQYKLKHKFKSDKEISAIEYFNFVKNYFKK